MENLIESYLSKAFIESVMQFDCHFDDFKTIPDMLCTLRQLVTKEDEDLKYALKSMISKGLLQSDDLSLIFLER